jgi:chaperonin GroEL
VTLQHLGRARTVTVTKDKTTIIDGAGSQEEIEQRITEIKSQIEKSESDYELEKLQSRLAKLTGGVAVLHIGAHTEVEMKEKKDRVDDALHATKAAVEEGIVPGGGVALLMAIHNANQLEDIGDNEEQKLGVQIIRKACEAPFRLIMDNAGLNAEVILSKIDIPTSHNVMGYDVRNAKVVNMVQEGIIDPTKVTRTALENASSVAGVLLTTEAVITTIKDEKENQQSNMMY